MPLARIVTRTPAELAALSEYLRTRGYTVEFVEPGTLRSTPAELEMDLQDCTAEEATSRGVSAAEAAQSHRERRVIAYDITGRPVAFADDEEPPAKAGNAITQAWNSLRQGAREMLENLRLSSGRLRDWVEEGRQTVREYRSRQREERDRAQAEKMRQQEAQVLAREAERARRQGEEEARRRELAERSRLLQEESVRQAAADQARREQEEAARRVKLAAARERIRQQQEETMRKELAERERRLLERFQREAHRDVVQERFQVEQSSARHEVAPAEAALARRQVQPPQPRRFQRDGDWKKAAVVACVIALLATLGYAAYANRQPAAPLSNRALVRSQTVSQPVPFGAATVPPPQATTTQQARQQRALPQSDIAPTAPAPKPSPRLRHHRRSKAAEDMIAEDEVVVHHTATATTPSRRNTATSGPKRISDLEQ